MSPHTRSMGSPPQEAYKVRSRPLPYPSHWCYANSIFQAFLHAPEFVKWLEKEHESCTDKYCLICAFHHLSVTYWTNLDWKPLSIAHGILRALLQHSSQFEEFLNPGEDRGWSWTIQQDAAVFYTEMTYALKERDTGSSIDDLFNYDITNRMTCPNCGEPSCAVESGPLLHVHFEDGARLEDILRDITFSPDIVENRNCDKCDTHVDTPNIHRLATGPPLLVMSLDRFTYTPQSGSKKNTASVPFAEELDLTPYTDNNFPLKYRLLSVIQHRGSTLGGGHFITIAKDRFEDWVALDDEEGEPFLAVGTDPFCPRKKNVQTDFMPYLLFWSRVDDAVVAAETPMNDASASTNDGTNGKASTDNDNHEDDEMQPLQISINGILQPPSRKYFVKKSALAGLKQRHIEGVYASTDSTLSELEARGREKEAKKKKKAENKKKEKAAEEVKKEKNKKTGKTSKKGIGKKRKEKTKTKTKTELKKPTTSSQKDTEKTAEKTQKAQKKEGKGEITTKKGKAEEGEEEEEKKPVSKKRKSPDPNSTSQQESKSVSKKQKSSNGNTSNSSQEKKNPGDSKKKK